jgi:hypothetical protein
VQQDVVCQWCRGTKFKITCQPTSVLLECSICRSRSSRTHSGWVADVKTRTSNDGIAGAYAYRAKAVVGFGAFPIKLVSPKETRTAVKPVDLDMPIEELNLPHRETRRFRENAIFNIGDLVKRSEVDLLMIPGFGRKCLNRTKEALSLFGLELSERGLPAEEKNSIAQKYCDYYIALREKKSALEFTVQELALVN